MKYQVTFKRTVVDMCNVTIDAGSAINAKQILEATKSEYYVVKPLGSKVVDFSVVNTIRI
jgi:hypothetical protein